MKTLIKHNFFTDGSHGWLKVSKSRLDKLNISDKITSCSFMRGTNAYLEEDCDLSTYVRALLLQEGIEPNTDEHTEFMKEFWNVTTVNDTSDSKLQRGSIIRSYERFKVFNDSELTEKNDLIEKLLNHCRWNKTGINRIKNGSLDDLRYWKELYKI